jgi:site-specific recombinase XerD
MEAPKFAIQKLGKHHFAHLKAVAMGIPYADSAMRYLGIHHGHQAITAHRLTVDSIRALARRQGEPAWRLIGLLISVDAANAEVPTLQEFCEERGLEDWSEEEITEFYLEAYPEQSHAAKSNKSKRRAKLRQQQTQLIEQLEKVAVVPPALMDPISSWYDPQTTQKLLNAGMVFLQDLVNKVSVGGRWYAAMPGVGPLKAQRIEAFLQQLLGPVASASNPRFALSEPKLNVLAASEVVIDKNRLPQQLTYEPVQSQLRATNDADAINEWISAKTKSTATAKSYRRETLRLLLWLREEAAGKSFEDMKAEDCKRYIDFLEDIPLRWQSKTKASPGTEGWAPFRGQLTHQSRQFALRVLSSFFAWLAAARYISGSPWMLVNCDLGDDPNKRKLDTKAFSEGTMKELVRVIMTQPPSPSRARILFILGFVEAVGLRSQELISAKLQDFSLEPEGLVLQVHGKGAKNRIAAVPGQAQLWLRQYLEAKNLPWISEAPGHYPLLSSLTDPAEHVGYQSLYQHVKGWLKKAVALSQIPAHERHKISGASTHWLRHTFGTRAVAKEVPPDVIQAQLGHASIQTTMNIYGRAPLKRQSQELDKAFK